MIEAGYKVNKWKNIFFTRIRELPESQSQGEGAAGRLWKQNPQQWLDLHNKNILKRVTDSEVREFILKMIAPNRADRPSIAEVTAFFEAKHEKALADSQNNTI